MKQAVELEGKQARRKFLAGLLASTAGIAALILAPRRGRTTPEKPLSSPQAGPILYRRTAEAERYYKTLYW